MNAKQTKLIEQAATVETDGEGWRKRMERWLDEQTDSDKDKPTLFQQLVRICFV